MSDCRLVLGGREMGNCAWCGDHGDSNGSHGICEPHSQVLYQQLGDRQWSKLQNTPSYIDMQLIALAGDYPDIPTAKPEELDDDAFIDSMKALGLI